MTDDPNRPLRLLSLDGGGIRGFSELIMLQNIMHRLAWDLKLDESKEILPCDYFDLIGGTSTGGIIAVLLGRLRLSVEECLDLYATLSEEVFGQKRWSLGGIWQSKFDHSILERVIKKTLKDLRDDKDWDGRSKPDLEAGENAMMHDTHPTACKSFVSATPGNQVQKDRPRLFRTYPSRLDNAVPDCPVWQAVRATSAAPTFFDHILIDGLDYVDGGFGCNNPSRQVYEEAMEIWPDREIGCLISLGTGMPRVLALDNPTLVNRFWIKDWVEVLIRVATECDEAHQEMSALRSMRGKYFRFNVQQGMQRISLEEWKKLGEVGTHTDHYMRDAEISRKVNNAVKLLMPQEEYEPDPYEPDNRRGSDEDLPSYDRAVRR